MCSLSCINCLTSVHCLVFIVLYQLSYVCSLSCVPCLVLCVLCLFIVLRPLSCRSGSPVALRCLDQHPTQPHIVATGGQNGELYIWDMRQDRAPATLVTCHQLDSMYT